MLRSYSMPTFSAKAAGSPERSAITEWSITSSTGTNGLIWEGEPPRPTSASRMAARSTTPGTPVKSCISTRSGVKAISRASSPALAPWASGCRPHAATAATSDAVTRNPSSWRSRFSRSTLTPYGRRATSPAAASGPAARLKISNRRSPTASSVRALKLSGCGAGSVMVTFCPSRARRHPPTAAGLRRPCVDGRWPTGPDGSGRIFWTCSASSSRAPCAPVRCSGRRS